MLANFGLSPSFGHHFGILSQHIHEGVNDKIFTLHGVIELQLGPIF
jgi:hypothetical protein